MSSHSACCSAPGARSAEDQPVTRLERSRRRQVAPAPSCPCGPARTAPASRRRRERLAPSSRASGESARHRRVNCAPAIRKAASEIVEQGPVRAVPQRSGHRFACHNSTASMSAATRASSIARPLPCETVTERAFGRIARATGTPSRSSPVTSATRVIPNCRLWSKSQSRTDVESSPTSSKGLTMACPGRDYRCPSRWLLLDAGDADRACEASV